MNQPCNYFMSELKSNDKLFYKYRPINDNTCKLIKDNELYFSNPDKFNDPFDCKLDFIYKGTRDEWIKFFCRQNMDIVAARNLIKTRLKDGLMKQKKNGVTFNQLESGDDVRACCFSERNESLLMWGHYAESHTGICLSFKTSAMEDSYLLRLDSENFLPFHRVDYSSDRPETVNLLDIDNQRRESLIYDFFLTKFDDWQYEKEYRLLANEHDLKGKDTINFRRDALEGIIFGLKVDPVKAQNIKKLIDRHYKEINVNFYRTEKSKRKYAIDVKKITNFDRYIKLLNK